MRQRKQKRIEEAERVRRVHAGLNPETGERVVGHEEARQAAIRRIDLERANREMELPPPKDPKAQPEAAVHEPRHAISNAGPPPVLGEPRPFVSVNPVAGSPEQRGVYSKFLARRDPAPVVLPDDSSIREKFDAARRFNPDQPEGALLEQIALDRIDSNRERDRAQFQDTPGQRRRRVEKAYRGGSMHVEIAGAGSSLRTLNRYRPGPFGS